MGGFNFNWEQGVNDQSISADYPSLEEIDKIARVAHFGQVDKLGVDYIEHPRAVARLIDSGVVPSYRDRATWWQYDILASALLHDVIEDTSVGIEELHAFDVPQRVIMTVALLTRKKGLSNALYYERIAGDIQARIVKIADMMHNCDPLRMALLDEETRLRLVAKYSKGIEVITSGFPEERAAFFDVTGV